MIRMPGFYANGSFTDSTSSSVFSPAAVAATAAVTTAAVVQPHHLLPLPMSMLQFGKRIPTEFCTFAVLRPSRIFYPNGRPQVRK